MEEAVAYTLRDLTVDTKYFSNGTIIPDPQHKEFGPPGPEADAVWSAMVERMCRLFPFLFPSSLQTNELIIPFLQIQTFAFPAMSSTKTTTIYQV